MDGPLFAEPFWVWVLPWCVLFSFDAELLVFARLDWFTSPLFDPMLRIEIGAFTFTCSLDAVLSADWLVLLLFSADWSCSTELPP